MISTKELPRVLLILLYLIFFALNSTFRGVIQNGQTTLLVLLLMLASLLLMHAKRDILAGIVMGIALSKYTVAFPIVLVAIYRRNLKAILVAISVQAVALVLLSYNTQSSPVDTLAAYIALAQYHSTSSMTAFFGTNLSAYLPQGLMVSVLALLTLVAIFGRYFLLFVKRPKLALTNGTQLLEQNLFVFAVMWSLVSVYHLGYDACLTIALYGLFLVVLSDRGSWKLEFVQLSWTLSILNQPLVKDRAEVRR